MKDNYNERTAKITSKNQITIPLFVRQKLKLNKGDLVEFEPTDNNSFLFYKSLEIVDCICEQDPNCIICLGEGEVRLRSSLYEHLKILDLQYGVKIEIHVYVQEGDIVVEFISKDQQLTEEQKVLFEKWYWTNNLQEGNDSD